MLIKIALVLCGLTLGAFSASNAFLNGTSLVPGPAGYIVGSALVALLVWSGLSGSLMSNAFANGAWVTGLILLAHWVFATALVLAMSIGFVASHRSESVNSRQIKIDSYQRAEANWQRINEEIKAADASGSVKRAATLRQELRTAETQLQAGRPASSDAQAETLSWVTGVAPDKIGRAMPIWLAVAIDVAFVGCFMAIGLVGNHRQQKRPVEKRRRSKRSSRRKAKVLRFPQITPLH
jgi:hypothetical protein